MKINLSKTTFALLAALLMTSSVNHAYANDGSAFAQCILWHEPGPGTNTPMVSMACYEYCRCVEKQAEQVEEYMQSVPLAEALDAAFLGRGQGPTLINCNYLEYKCELSS